MPACGDLSARAEGRRPKASQEGTRATLHGRPARRIARIVAREQAGGCRPARRGNHADGDRQAPARIGRRGDTLDDSIKQALIDRVRGYLDMGEDGEEPPDDPGETADLFSVPVEMAAVRR